MCAIGGDVSFLATGVYIVCSKWQVILFGNGFPMKLINIACMNYVGMAVMNGYVVWCSSGNDIGSRIESIVCSWTGERLRRIVISGEWRWRRWWKRWCDDGMDGLCEMSNMA